MQELLLNTVKRRQLFDDEYLGEVLASDFITGDALASMVGLTAGTSQNSNTNWLKFRSEDKILYVAKKNIRHTVSWNHLNTANVIDGTRIVTIGEYKYRIRLLKGLNPDTTIPFAIGYDVPSGYNSEWNRLMYPVSIDLPTYPKTSQVIDNWASFPQDDSPDGLNIGAGNGRYSWCQETNPLMPANRVYRGSQSVTDLGSGPSSLLLAVVGWRPVLEWVDPKTLLFPPEDLFYTTDFVVAPRITDHYYTD